MDKNTAPFRLDDGICLHYYISRMKKNPEHILPFEWGTASSQELNIERVETPYVLLGKFRAHLTTFYEKGNISDTLAESDQTNADGYTDVEQDAIDSR